MFPQITYYYQRNSKFTMEKSGRPHPSQVAKVTVIYTGTKRPHGFSWYKALGRAPCRFCDIPAKKCKIWTQAFRKYHTNSDQRTLYKITSLYFSKISRSRRFFKRLRNNSGTIQARIEILEPTSGKICMALKNVISAFDEI